MAEKPRHPLLLAALWLALPQRALEIIQLAGRALEFTEAPAQLPQHAFGALADGALQGITVRHVEAVAIFHVAALVRLRPPKRVRAILGAAAHASRNAA